MCCCLPFLYLLGFAQISALLKNIITKCEKLGLGFGCNLIRQFSTLS
jgi:hypothetical protein